MLLSEGVAAYCCWVCCTKAECQYNKVGEYFGFRMVTKCCLPVMRIKNAAILFFVDIQPPRKFRQPVVGANNIGLFPVPPRSTRGLVVFLQQETFCKVKQFF
jgi:hypothetical protein